MNKFVNLGKICKGSANAKGKALEGARIPSGWSSRPTWVMKSRVSQRGPSVIISTLAAGIVAE